MPQRSQPKKRMPPRRHGRREQQTKACFKAESSGSSYGSCSSGNDGVAAAATNAARQCNGRMAVLEQELGEENDVRAELLQEEHIQVVMVLVNDASSCCVPLFVKHRMHILRYRCYVDVLSYVQWGLNLLVLSWWWDVVVQSEEYCSSCGCEFESLYWRCVMCRFNFFSGVVYA